MKLKIETVKYGVKTVYLDDKDYPLIKKYTWHVMLDKGTFYARCNIWVRGKQKSPKMHRVIMGLMNRERPHIDHVNGNGLDNRRRNLRIATISQNSVNVGLIASNKTGYKGVYLYKSPHQNAGKYTATTRCKGKAIHGGYFNTAIEAAVRYNELALKYHKEFSFLNKINKIELAKAKLYVPPVKVAKPTVSKTGYYGVRHDKSVWRKKQFSVVIRKKYYGYFETSLEAAKAYDNVAKSIYGINTTRLNFK